MPDRVSSPKTSACLARSSAPVMRSSAACSASMFMVAVPFRRLPPADRRCAQPHEASFPREHQGEWRAGLKFFRGCVPSAERPRAVDTREGAKRPWRGAWRSPGGVRRARGRMAPGWDRAGAVAMPALRVPFGSSAWAHAGFGATSPQRPSPGDRRAVWQLRSRGAVNQFQPNTPESHTHYIRGEGSHWPRGAEWTRLLTSSQNPVRESESFGKIPLTTLFLVVGGCSRRRGRERRRR